MRKKPLSRQASEARPISAIAWKTSGLTDMKRPRKTAGERAGEQVPRSFNELLHEDRDRDCDNERRNVARRAEEADRHDGEECRKQEVDAEPARIADHLPEQMADDRRSDPRQDHHE